MRTAISACARMRACACTSTCACVRMSARPLRTSYQRVWLALLVDAAVDVTAAYVSNVTAFVRPHAKAMHAVLSEQAVPPARPPARPLGTQ